MAADGAAAWSSPPTPSSATKSPPPSRLPPHLGTRTSSPPVKLDSCLPRDPTCSDQPCYSPVPCCCSSDPSWPATAENGTSTGRAGGAVSAACCLLGHEENDERGLRCAALPCFHCPVPDALRRGGRFGGSTCKIKIKSRMNESKGGEGRGGSVQTMNHAAEEIRDEEDEHEPLTCDSSSRLILCKVEKNDDEGRWRGRRRELAGRSLFPPPPKEISSIAGSERPSQASAPPPSSVHAPVVSPLAHDRGRHPRGEAARHDGGERDQQAIVEEERRELGRRGGAGRGLGSEEGR